MRIVRFREGQEVQLAAVTDEGAVYALPDDDFMSLIYRSKKEGMTPLSLVRSAIASSKPVYGNVDALSLLVPIEAPEVWAAGVTYERSKEARNYEATGGKMDETTFYDKVYAAVRPEIFFKSTAARTIGPEDEIYLRSDSNWQIPEPELALVIDGDGSILGYTIGNDVSSRDIEGENPLYLPQAKIWKNSCVIGPAIRLAETVEDPYKFQITCRIYRDGIKTVEGTASTGQLKRKLEELISFLTLDNIIFDGTILLTGTCIVPPNEFTLASGDRVEIDITGIGTLTNAVQ